MKILFMVSYEFKLKKLLMKHCNQLIKVVGSILKQ